MAVSPEDFLTLGRSVEGRADCSEIELRSAYRCAYYAVHHAAKQALPRLGLVLVKARHGGAHADVEVSLINAGTHEAKELVAQMKRLKRFRVDCDYYLEKTIDRGLLSARLADAADTFASLMRLGILAGETFPSKEQAE